jgi:integrase
MTEPVGRFFKGTLRQVPRAKGKWAWEWRYIDPATGAQQSKYFTALEFPDRLKLETHLEPFVDRLNSAAIDKLEATEKAIVDPSMGDLLDKFIQEERLLEIKARKPGERAERKDELAYSTASSYLSISKRIREKWGATKLDKFRPLDFQNWLKALESKPKTKGHLKAFVNRLFYKAKLYGMLDFVENPIGLVEVRGISKRRRKPANLTVEQIFLVLDLLPEPYYTMGLTAVCTGLRADELLALLWSAIDFERLCMKINEGVVNGRIGPVKTEYSEDELPLDPDFATILLEWKLKSNESKLVFPSPITGRSFHASPIQQDWIRRAGWCLVKCPACGAEPGVACSQTTNGRGKLFNIPVHDSRKDLAFEMKLDGIGWGSFRHAYRSLLSKCKTPLDVQQKLMRHAHISTTGQYGGPPIENQREANSNVVRDILTRRSSR